MDFIDDNGLINSKPNERKSENSPLWSLEYILVKKMCGVGDQEMRQNLYTFFEKCKIRPGLYNQRDFLDGTPEDYMSHDQASALCAYSYMNGWTWHKQIWKEIKRQGYRYDNLNPDKPRRWLHPRDIIYYGILNNVAWCNWLFPIFSTMMVITCKKPTETSGKLLAFVRCAALADRKPKFMKLFLRLTDIIRDNETMGSWERVFEIYFPYILHPTREFIQQGRSNVNFMWLFER